MDAEWAVWAAVLAACLAMLAVDLRLGPREGAPLRSAVTWSVGWLIVGVVVALPVWALRGGTAAGEYVTGYAIERSLSLDNVLVFAVMFTALAVPAALRPPALTFGIGAALVLRGAFIAAGAALLAVAGWIVYPLGAFLVATGVQIARDSGHGGAGSRVLAVVGRLPLGNRPLVAARRRGGSGTTTCTMPANLPPSCAIWLRSQLPPCASTSPERASTRPGRSSPSTVSTSVAIRDDASPVVLTYAGSRTGGRRRRRGRAR